MLHTIPADETGIHEVRPGCPCGPTVGEIKRPGGAVRVGYQHHGHDRTAGDERQEGPNHAAARP